MTSPGRRAALCQQSVRALTGIDFVQVVDPGDQRQLRVFFVIEPDRTAPPIILPAQVPALGAASSEGPPVAVVGPSLTVRIETVAEGTPAAIASLAWRRVRTAIDTRVALEINVGQPGGFEPYRLVLSHPSLDPLSSTLDFDFKQACPTGFDCQAEPDCPGEAPLDVDIHYLARDFDSLRRVLLDFTALRYPHWREPVEADFGTMMLEVMAALGDHFAYQQDRSDGETRFASATQRASLAAHSRLVDYRPFRGSPASGSVLFTALAGGVVPADARVWGQADAATPVVFSTVADLWVHPFWNALPAHNPNPGQDCLPHGATSLMLRSSVPLAAQTPTGVTRAEFLLGKRVMILSDPASAAWPRRAIPVTITDFQDRSDPLILTGGAATPITEIRWSADEATPVDLPFDGLTVAMNLVEVMAGERIVEYLRIGDATALGSSHPGLAPTLLARMAALPQAIEREGPQERLGTGRDVILRHGLAATEGASLRHRPDGWPDVEVHEVEPPTPPPALLPQEDDALFSLFQEGEAFPYLDDLLDGDRGDPCFTLEPGMWRTVKRHQQRFGCFAFRDYAADSGWTLRFGSGDFGRGPADGAVVRVRYRTDPGPLANIPSDSLALTPPPGQLATPGLATLVTAVTNPLPFSNALPEESAASIRTAAPEAFRALPRRAVRPEDYGAILGRLAFVQRAHAVTHWTGSWSTDFVAVDPLRSVALTAAQRHWVDRELNSIRLASRDVRRLEAEYLDIDIDISFCVAPDAYAGEVFQAVSTALAAPGFFAPDNFTFGTPLVRSSLVAAAQAVAGVRYVDQVRIRVHGMGDWREFSEAQLMPAAHQIVRLQNDPDRAAMGILRVHSDRSAVAGS